MLGENPEKPSFVELKTGELSMTIARTITMVALAPEALEKIGNNADAATTYLSQRLRDDSELREALVKSAVEYERLAELHS